MTILFNSNNSSNTKPSKNIFSTFGRIKPSYSEKKFDSNKIIKKHSHGFTYIFFWIIIASILSFISYRFFVQAINPNFRNMAGGVSGISMLTGLMAFPHDIERQALVTFGSAIAFNIPFLTFGYLKVGKKFTLYSIAYLVIQFAIQLALIFSPDANRFINDHFLFPWNGDSSSNIDDQLRACLNAIIGGVLYGFSCVFIYNAGACAGGTDFVSFYVNLKKNKNIGYINFLINTGIVIVGVTILAFQQPFKDPITGNVNSTQTFINTGVRFIATFLYILVNSFIVDKYYPKQKIVNLTLVLNDLTFLDEALKVLNIQRSYTYLTATGAYSKKTKYMCYLIMTDYELKLFKIYLKKIQVPPEVFISVTYSQHISGRFRALYLED